VYSLLRFLIMVLVSMAVWMAIGLGIGFLLHWVVRAIDLGALVQLNGDNFLFYNKSLGDLNVEKFTHKHPRSVDGVNDVWHAYPHSSRNLHDIGIARKLDWRLYKRLF
jgi:hypothetical protein